MGILIERLRAVGLEMPAVYTPSGFEISRKKDSEPVFGRVDTKIAPAVKALNKLDFIATVTSCAGHFNREGILRGGFLAFLTDHRMLKAADFFDSLEELMAKYPRSNLDVMKPSFKQYGLPLCGIDFDLTDLFLDKLPKGINRVTSSTPGTIQLGNRKLGEQIVGDYHKFWQDLASVAGIK